MDIPLGGVSAKRQIGMADLLFWAQKLLEADDSFSVQDCRDGTLFARILAQIVDSRSGRALEGAINKDARTRDDRLENLALVCTVMREGGGEGWDGDVQEVEDANEEAIIDLLMAMYRLYFKNCTTQVSPTPSEAFPHLHHTSHLPSFLLAPSSSLILPTLLFPSPSPSPSPSLCLSLVCGFFPPLSQLSTDGTSTGQACESSCPDSSRTRLKFGRAWGNLACPTCDHG